MKKLLLACLLALAAPVCGATPALVQSASGHTSSGTTCTTTLNNVAVGDTLIWDGYEITTDTLVSITDSSGNTVSAANAWTVNASPASGFGIYYVQATIAGTHTITLTISGSTNITCQLSRWSGLSTSAPFDTSASLKFTASSSSVSSNSFTPSANGELILFFIGQQGSGLTWSSYNNSFVQQYNYNSSGPSAAVASEIQATAAPISGSATSSAAASYATGIAAFVPASGPPPSSQVTVVNSSAAYVPDSTQCIATNLAPVAGDDLVAVIETFGASPTVTGVASTVSATVTTDSAFAVNGTNTIGYGVYRVHDAANESQGITVTFNTPIDCEEWLFDVSDLGSLDQVSSVASGTTTAFATPSITPTKNGAALIAIGGSNYAETWSAWTNSFMAVAGNTAGPSAVAAYLEQTTAASVDATATLSAANPWSGFLLDYIPAATCTHAGLAQNGTESVPNGSSGLYWGKNGNWVTPDCATVEYWQPSVLNWGVN